MEKLLYKYLYNKLSEEEDKELQEWLKKDRENLEVFENIVGDWNLSHQYVDNAKEKIISQIFSQNKTLVKESTFEKVIGIATFRKISIAAAAVIALFILNLYKCLIIMIKYN